MELDAYIDIEDSAGNRLGSGPIVGAAYFEYDARMDRAGRIAFGLPATVENAALIQRKRVARAWVYIEGAWVEFGAGVIDNITRQVADDGRVQLVATGDCLLRELTYRSVLDLRLYIGGNPVSHAAAVAAVGGYAPAGWTFTADAVPPNNLVYGRFNGDSVLAGLIKVAEKSLNHFYRGIGRSLIFSSTFTDSGVRAIAAGPGELSPETCAITDLTEVIDTYEYVNRIYPRGSGNGDVQLTLAATTRTAPAGYTLNKTQNYIEYNAGVAAYGVIEQQLDYRDVGPVENTDADLVAASNMLFDAALEELTRRSVELEEATYDLAVAQCGVVLRPMQRVWVVWRDEDAGIDVDRSLNILEARNRVDASGLRTTGLVVSTADRWRESDTDAIAGTIAEGQTYQALPQLNANSYVTAYTKNVDESHIASFRFRFGREVTQLQQVLFEFQILPFESTVKSVGSATSGSGVINTGGPSTNSTGASGNNETGSSGGGTTSETTPTINAATPSINTTTPTISTTTPTISVVTPTIGQTTPTIGSTGLTTSAPQGDDIAPGGRHGHQMAFHRISTSLGGYTLQLREVSPGTWQIDAVGAGVGSPILTSNPIIDYGNHTHTMSPHTHTIAPHTHTMAGHTHTMSGHTHTMAGHTHTMSGHSHTMSGHTHTMSPHTHTMGNHTHSLNNHTHDLSGSISAVYGIYREQSQHTYGIGELEYRVNGGAWADLNVAVSVGSGWYQLDITNQVMDTTTLRPLQPSNMLEIRASVSIPLAGWSTLGDYLIVDTTVAHGVAVNDFVKIAGASTGNLGSNINGEYKVDTILNTHQFSVLRGSIPSGQTGAAGGAVIPNKTATIDAQLSVRNIIQAVAYV